MEEAERARDRFRDSNSTNEQNFQKLRKKCMEDQEALRKEHEHEINLLKTKHAEDLMAKNKKISEQRDEIDKINL